MEVHIFEHKDKVNMLIRRDFGSLSIQITDKTSEIPYIHQLVLTQKAINITEANTTVWRKAIFLRFQTSNLLYRNELAICSCFNVGRTRRR